ncbi:ketopantoate reductase family protein [Shewanella donghaensis]|uniref:ketopantoate reductase family protein n=1 Tax=Shewanella donghaensis TaxID=238836 RepID=UPI001182C694|nr:2-dehydropantoate 2-reductase [Shewanella donghaensis]
MPSSFDSLAHVKSLQNGRTVSDKAQIKKTQTEIKHHQANIAILGAGAIGLLIYTQLAKFRAPLLLTRNTIESNRYITVETLSGEIKQQACLEANIEQLEQADLANIELVIICVKSYQIADALSSLLPIIPKACHILLIHNGMGPHLEAQAMLKPYDKLNLGISLGTTSQASLKLSQRHIRHTGKGKSVIGHLTGSAMPVAVMSQLMSSIPDISIKDDILTALWQKLIVNCAINPLTAINQCPNGELAQQIYQQQIHAIAQECITVAKADGVNLDLADSLSVIADVIHQTAANSSSMKQDIQLGRKTEIKQINGYVVARAKCHQLAVPVNEHMLCNINALEALQG